MKNEPKRTVHYVDGAVAIGRPCKSVCGRDVMLRCLDFSTLVRNVTCRRCLGILGKRSERRKK